MQFTVKDATITVNMPNRATLLSEVAARFARHDGFALATLNLDHLVKLRDDAAFRAAYRAHDLVTADGNPVVWLSRTAGQPVTLVPGSDLVLPLCRAAVTADVPVALVGGRATTLDRAAERLTEEVPGLQIVLKHAPPMGFDPNSPMADDILHAVGASGARLCFLALGAPRQEILAARGRTAVPQVGFASIGAGLDFLAGDQARAPAWVRAIAMEWFWRMATNPRRLAGRYFRSGLALPGLWLQARQSRQSR